MMIVRYLTILWFFCGAFYPAAYADDAFYHVRGVTIDARNADLVTAKESGVQAAKRDALQLLMKRMVANGATFPLPQNAEIETMIAQSQILNETFGGDRYLAELSVKFLPQAVRRYLNRSGVAFIESAAPTVQIIPQERLVGVDVNVLPNSLIYQAWQGYLNVSQQNFNLVPFALISAQDALGDTPSATDSTASYIVQSEFFQLENTWLEESNLEMRVNIQSSGDSIALNASKMFSLSILDGQIDWQPAFDWVRAEIDSAWQQSLLQQVGDMNQQATLPLVILSSEHSETIALRQGLENMRSVDLVQIERITVFQLFLNVRYRGSLENFYNQLAVLGVHIRQPQTETEAAFAENRAILEYTQ